jgi:chromosome segregation ATPase
MSNNDFERKFEFLVRQQVQSAAETQALRESLLGLAIRTDSIATSVDRLTTRTDSLAASVEGLTTRIDSLAASVEGLTTRTDSLAASVEGLTTRTDSLAASVEGLGRKVDVLVEVQADQHTRLARVEDSFVLLVQMARLTDERLDAFENRFSEVVEWLGGKVDTLVDVQADQHTRLVRVEDSFVLLVQMAKLTEERLDAFENRFSEVVEWLGGKDTLVEAQADQQPRLVRVEDSFVLLVQMAKLTDERLDAFENRFSEFDSRFSDIGARLITLSDHIATLAKVQSQSDERLNTFIDTVERYVRHNGGNANE